MDVNLWVLRQIWQMGKHAAEEILASTLEKLHINNPVFLEDEAWEMMLGVSLLSFHLNFRSSFSTLCCHIYHCHFLFIMVNIHKDTVQKWCKHHGIIIDLYLVLLNFALLIPAKDLPIACTFICCKSFFPCFFCRCWPSFSITSFDFFSVYVAPADQCTSLIFIHQIWMWGMEIVLTSSDVSIFWNIMQSCFAAQILGNMGRTISPKQEVRPQKRGPLLETSLVTPSQSHRYYRRREWGCFCFCCSHHKVPPVERSCFRYHLHGICQAHRHHACLPIICQIMPWLWHSAGMLDGSCNTREDPLHVSFHTVYVKDRQNRDIICTHVRKVHLGVYIACHICGWRAWTRELWERHMIDKHDEKNLYPSDLSSPPMTAPCSVPSSSRATVTMCGAASSSPEDQVSSSMPAPGPILPGFELVQLMEDEKQDVKYIMEAMVKVKKGKENKDQPKPPPLWKHGLDLM